MTRLLKPSLSAGGLMCFSVWEMQGNKTFRLSGEELRSLATEIFLDAGLES